MRVLRGTEHGSQYCYGFCELTSTKTILLLSTVRRGDESRNFLPAMDWQNVDFEVNGLSRHAELLRGGRPIQYKECHLQR